MYVEFINRGRTRMAQIDDARIIWRNFAGRGDRFNPQGNREFSMVIPNDEIADAFLNDMNEFGAAWKVKIKAPKEEGDEPFRFMKVKVSYKGRGPKIYLITNGRKNELDEEDVHILDDIDISRVNLDIRAYDGEDGPQGPFRSAYLQAMEVYQDLDRFAAKYVDNDEEAVF